MRVNFTAKNVCCKHSSVSFLCLLSLLYATRHSTQDFCQLYVIYFPRKYLHGGMCGKNSCASERLTEKCQLLCCLLNASRRSAPHLTLIKLHQVLMENFHEKLTFTVARRVFRSFSLVDFISSRCKRAYMHGKSERDSIVYVYCVYM